MNGIFINQKKIPSRKPVTLKVGDVLGIGAIENSQPQYFIFDVLKSVVKNEDQVITCIFKILPLMILAVDIVLFRF